MGRFIALANCFLDAHRVAKKGETLELGDAEALDLLRNKRVEPADEATRKRFRSETRTTWSEPQQTAAPPGSWLSWRN